MPKAAYVFSKFLMPDSSMGNAGMGTKEYKKGQLWRRQILKGKKVKSAMAGPETQVEDGRVLD